MYSSLTLLVTRFCGNLRCWPKVEATSGEAFRARHQKNLAPRVFFLGMDNTTVSFTDNLIKSVKICFKVVCLLATR